MMDKLTNSFILGILFLFSNSVLALGLGGIKVYSHLNSPLNVEIELIAAENIENIEVNVATYADFAKANIDRIPYLDTLNLQLVEMQAGKTVKITSNEPLKEPVLNLLIALRWPDGNLVREYNLLFNPGK